MPALPSLYGTLDASFGHYRRYTKGQIKHLVSSAGFCILRLRFFNIIGVFTWFLMGKVLRWQTWGASPVIAYDRIIIPLLRRFESLVPPPFGQSLLLAAVKL